MRHRSFPDLGTSARGVVCAALGLALAGACGGQSFKGNGGEAGDSASGGATTFAGSNSSGGKASAGSSSRGGSNGKGGGGGSAAASAGGSGPAFMGACAGPPEIPSPNGAVCDAYIPRWTHDITTGLCLPYVYGGCGATKNNYETLEACQTACPGGSPNYDVCNAAKDCVLAANGCCGVCDGPSVSKRDFIAYNKAYESVVSTCGSGDVACGACPGVPEGQGTSLFFFPDCVAGECVVQDIRESDVTACKSAQDCRLRNGTRCCEGCSSVELVAVRNDGSFNELACGGPTPPCLSCVPPPPPSDALATCGANGHCEVAILLK